MTKWSVAGLAGALLLAMPATARVGIFVPYFSGPGALGRNVSTSLYFQIWRTFRRAPFPNARRLDFGGAIARYATQPLDLGDAASSSAIARAIEQEAHSADTQMVLWGNVRALGDGVLVQAFLAAPASMSQPDQSDRWTVRDGGRSLTLDLPRRVFDFDPIVMSRDLVALYSSPDAMRMCLTKALPCDALPLSDDWVANRQEPGGWAFVTATATRRSGWLYLRNADRLPNSVSDFAAALVSYYRADWEQAARLFDAVARRNDAQSIIRADAAALAALARARGGAANAGEFEALLDANPYSLYLLQAAVTARVAAALATSDPRPALRTLAKRVDVNRGLFAADDAWLASFDRLIGARLATGR